MGIECYSRLKIPVSTIPISERDSKKTFEPSADNLQGPVFHKMRYMKHKGQEVLSCGRHSVIAIKPPTPHCPINEPIENMVYWIAENSKNGNDIKPWIVNENASLKKLAKDNSFLNALEEMLQGKIKAGSNIFFVTGWSPKFKPSPNDPPPPPNITRRGLPTFPSLHIHETPPFSLVKPDRMIRLDFEKPMKSNDLLITKLFLNFAGEVAEVEFKRLLANFANHKQNWIAAGGVPRTAYGFLHLNELIQQLAEFDEIMSKLWPTMLYEVSQEYSRHYMIPQKNAEKYMFESLLLIPRVFTTSVCIPSLDDKRLMQLPPDDPCFGWVFPFAIAPKQVLIDGIFTERKKMDA